MARKSYKDLLKEIEESFYKDTPEEERKAKVNPYGTQNTYQTYQGINKYIGSTPAPLKKKKKKEEEKEIDLSNKLVPSLDDITTVKKEEKDPWYKNIIEPFNDGYDFGDVTKTAGNAIGSLWDTTTATVGNFGMGIEGFIPKVSDALTNYQSYLTKKTADFAIDVLVDDEKSAKMGKVISNAIIDKATDVTPIGKFNADVNSEEMQQWRQETIQANFEKAKAATGETGYFLAENALSTGNQVIPMATAFIPGAGAVLSPALFMVGASSDYMKSAEQKGMNENQKMAYATTMGVLEGGFDYFLGVGTLKAGAKLLFGKDMLKNAGGFGVKIVENIVQEAAMEPTSEYVASLSSMSEEELGKVLAGQGKYADWDDMGTRMLRAGAHGGLSAVVMGGAGTGINSAVYTYNVTSVTNQTAQAMQEQLGRELTKAEHKALKEQVKAQLKTQMLAEGQMSEEEINQYEQMTEEELVELAVTETIESGKVDTEAILADVEQGLKEATQEYKQQNTEQEQNIEETEKSEAPQAEISDVPEQSQQVIFPEAETAENTIVEPNTAIEENIPIETAQNVSESEISEENDTESEDKKQIQVYNAVRLDEKNANLDAEAKPHGLFLSNLYETDFNEFESPFARQYEGGERHHYKVEPKNPLVVKPLVLDNAKYKYRSGNMATMEADASLSALKELVSEQEFTKVSEMSKQELVEYLNNKYSQYDFSNYYDKAELLMAYGSVEARNQGYDAIITERSTDPDTADIDNEIVVLKNDILKTEAEATQDDIAPVETEQKGTPTAEEIDNIIKLKDEGGQKYAKAYYEAQDKYGSTEFYKALNEGYSRAKNGTQTEDIAPVKESKEEYIKNRLAELKAIDISKMSRFSQERRAITAEINALEDGYTDVEEHEKVLEQRKQDAIKKSEEERAKKEAERAEKEKPTKVNSININEPVKKGYTRLYRGLEKEYSANYDGSKIDNSNGYESWTDDYELAKQYGDNVYAIDVPTKDISKTIIDDNPSSETYGARNLLYKHDKPVGIKGASGNEYMLYTDHGNYSNIEYRKVEETTQTEQVAEQVQEAVKPLQETVSELTEQVKKLTDQIENAALNNPTIAENVADTTLDQQVEGNNEPTGIVEDTTPDFEDNQRDTSKVESPFENRDIKEVGNRKVKAYMYENPEVKPYFQEAAQYMLGDLKNTIKGERIFNSQLAYEEGIADQNGAFGWVGIARQTTEDIAYLKDNFGYSYAEIEEGLNKIIEDNGLENNAVSKRIEFMLDERLRNGYADVAGMPIPANQDYINLLDEKQISEYNSNRFAEMTDEQLSEELARNTAETTPKANTDNQGRTISKELQEELKDSKVRDEQGHLLTVYHGTAAEFTEFDEQFAKSGDYGVGFYFTDSNDVAQQSAEMAAVFKDVSKYMDGTNKGKVIEAYLDIKKPSMWKNYLDMKKYEELAEKEGISFYDYMRKNYDGIIVTKPRYDNEGYSDAKYYIVFKPNQIKHTDNANDGITLPEANTDTLVEETTPDIPIAENVVETAVEDAETVVNNRHEEIIASNETEPAIETTQGTTAKPTNTIHDDMIDATINRMTSNLATVEASGYGTNRSEKAKKTFREKVKNAVNTFQDLMVNRSRAVDQLAKQTGNAEIKYKNDRLNNVMAEISGEINVAQTDLYGNKIGDAMITPFLEADNAGLREDFNYYLTMIANIERSARDKGLGTIDAVTSQEIVKAYEQEHPEFIEWKNKVVTYNRNALYNDVAAGIVSKELADQLTAMYPNYMPYYFDIDNNFALSPDEIKAGKTVKTAVGGGDITKIFTIEEAMTKQTISRKIAQLKNDVLTEIVNSQPAVVEFELGNIEASELGETVFTDASGKKYATAYIDGKAKTVEISDDLYNAFNNDLDAKIKELEEKFELITKPLQTATTVFGKMNTTWSLTFPITNPIKDMFDAPLNSKHTARWLGNAASGRALLKIKNNDATWQQFKSLYGTDTLQQEYGGGVKTEKIGKNLKFLNKIGNLNQFVEMYPRYLEFLSSVEAGDSTTEALYNAREVTTNFGRGGTIAKAINRNGVAFFNVSIQGFDKLRRNFSGENGAMGIVKSLAKVTALGMLPAIFNHLMFGDDEEYEELSDYVKDNYYLIEMGDGDFFRIPKGRMLSIFGSAARRTLELAEGEENAFDGYLTNAWTQVGFSNPITDNIFAGFIDVANNETWYGSDLIPTRLNDDETAPEEQYDESTDEFSKWLGELIGVSPMKTNYLLDQYGGSIADIVLPMITDEAKSDKEGLLGTIGSIFTNKFTSNSTFNNKYVSEFYDTKDKIGKIPDSKATEEEKLQAKYLNDVGWELSDLYKKKRTIQTSLLDNAEKYKAVEKVQREIDDISKAALDQYKDVDKSDDYAVIGDKEYYKKDNTWEKVKDKDLEDVNGLGLTTKEKGIYFNTKTELGKLKTKDEKETHLYKAKLDKTIKTAIYENSVLDGFDKEDTHKAYKTAKAIGVDIDTWLDFEKQTYYADKDKNGESIDGTKKKKVFEHINSQELSIPQKAIMFKLQYPKDKEYVGTTYNNDIFSYVDGLDTTYAEKVEILENIGFKVDGNGNVKW